MSHAPSKELVQVLVLVQVQVQVQELRPAQAQQVLEQEQKLLEQVLELGPALAQAQRVQVRPLVQHLQHQRRQSRGRRERCHLRSREFQSTVPKRATEPRCRLCPWKPRTTARRLQRCRQPS